MADHAKYCHAHESGDVDNAAICAKCGRGVLACKGGEDCIGDEPDTSTAT